MAVFEVGVFPNVYQKSLQKPGSDPVNIFRRICFLWSIILNKYSSFISNLRRVFMIVLFIFAFQCNSSSGLVYFTGEITTRIIAPSDEIRLSSLVETAGDEKNNRCLTQNATVHQIFRKSFYAIYHFSLNAVWNSSCALSLLPYCLYHHRLPSKSLTTNTL